MRCGALMTALAGEVRTYARFRQQVICQLYTRDRPGRWDVANAGFGASGQLHNPQGQIAGPNYRAMLIVNDGNRQFALNSIAEPIQMPRSAVWRRTDRQADPNH